MNDFLPGNYWLSAMVVVPIVAIYASIIDFREHRIPNWLNAALAAGGIGCQTIYFGWSGLGTAAAGLLLGFGLLIIPWTTNNMGAGDVKLIAAIGAWMGPWLIFLGFLTGVMIGGVMGVVIILVRGNLAQSRANLNVLLIKNTRADTAFGAFGSTESFGERTTLLPYGIPLTIGALLVLGGRFLEWAVLL